MKKIDLTPLLYSIIMALMMVLGSSNLFGQPTPVFVECTAGDYPDEIGWEILTCDSSLILEGGAPYFGAAQIADSYIIHMTDTYGDGWNGAYLTIDTISYGFLSDVDWIDSLGTWPQEYLYLKFALFRKIAHVMLLFESLFVMLSLFLVDTQFHFAWPFLLTHHQKIVALLFL